MRNYSLTYSGREVQALLDKIHDLGLATLTVPGLMSIEDKAKLDGIGIKSGTTEYWNNARGYVPAAGEIVIYTDKETIVEEGVSVPVPGIKVGSGNAYVQDLAFLGAAESSRLLEHIADDVRHVTAAERTRWNRKLNVTDGAEVVDETLIFNRD